MADTNTTGSRPVVTRFAPSPTGHLHVGGARTALFAWAVARGAGGRFLLRVEDTDQARSSEDSARGILEDLAWLGIDWDEGPELQAGGKQLGGDTRGVGPFYQAKRLHLYGAALQKLLEEEKAYHAFETTQELDAARKAATDAKRQYRYDRAGLGIPKDARFARAAAGEPHVVRFCRPEGNVVFCDEVYGRIEVDSAELDDFIIRKADGFPTYHFAVVVDDHAMGVTHVVRGQEHLINTPRHVAIQAALGYGRPVYAHLPLIFNADGSKMSKRDKDKAVRKACKDAGAEAPLEGIEPATFGAWMRDNKRQLQTNELLALAGAIGVALPEIDVDDFRQSGYLPEVVCNFLALLGWSPGNDLEKFDNALLCDKLDLGRVVKSAGKFDRKKLLAFNTDAVAGMTDEAFRKGWRAWCTRYAPKLLERLEPATFDALADGLRPRSKTYAEAADSAAFALMDDRGFGYDEKALAKNLRKNEAQGLGLLREFRERLAVIQPFTGAGAHGAMQSLTEERGVGMGKLAQPVRLAVTGTTVSPPIDATLEVLGRERSLARIDRLLAHEDALAPTAE